MKVRRKSYPKTEVSIDSAIVDSLDGNDYGVGELEAIKATLRNTQELLAKLIRIQAESGLITKEELDDLIGYNYEVIP